MSNVSFTDDQFRDLLGVLASRQSTPPPSPKSGSFAPCTARYDGTRDCSVVEAFISTITTYKNIENIIDSNAIEGLTLLLTGEAAIWWLGVKTEVTVWSDAISLIRTTFAPKRPAYKIYEEIVGTKQLEAKGTELFVAKKRALMAELPKPSLLTSQCLDLLYSSLHVDIRDRIPRDTVTNFDEFLRKARQIEEVLVVRTPTHNRPTEPGSNTGKRLRCTYCRAFGHTEDKCRKKEANSQKLDIPTHNTGQYKPVPISKITCYGCGEPGVVRSKCAKCNAGTRIGSVEVGFYALDPSLSAVSRLRPTVDIQISGVKGRAHLDTGAKLSVASYALYNLLEQKGTTFNTETATITLADGLRRRQLIKRCAVPVTISGRTVMTNFIVLPESHDNRTLLGVDFIQDANIILNLPQLLYHFLDKPGTKFDLVNEVEETNSVAALQTHTRTSTMAESAISKLVKLTALEPVVSPIHSTPDQTTEVVTETTYGPPALIGLVTPPASPTRKSPKLYGYSPRFVGSLYRDAQMAINMTDVELSPHSNSMFGPSVDIAMVSVEYGTQLTIEQQERLEAILDQSADVFTANGKPAALVEHVIDTGTHVPIAVPPYRMSPLRKEILRKEIDQMLAEGVIEESNSPWAAPVVMVPKKNGDVRVCIDYRQLNNITVPDAYPLPRIDDLLHEAKPSPYMTSLDLKAGYWQIQVRPEDQRKTAFVTPFGLYEFKRMPFGLRNAPATFQRFIDRLRIQIDAQLLAYLDDLILMSPTFDRHLQDLEELFKLLRNNNVVVNKKKCRFCQEQVPYLGHIITRSGLQTDPAKVLAITEMPIPQNVKQVQSFLQTCSWYRRFVPNFAKCAQPLTQLTKKNAVWDWGTKQQSAYDELKRCLTSAPILRQADISKPYTIKTDASDYALGAVLVQGEGLDEHPVEYASRLLTKAERNYSTTEREALAVIWAVSKFRGYIEGSTVIIATDHQALKWLMSLKSPTGRLARWALQLQPYNLKIEYIPGKTNTVADGLSRPPHEDFARTNHEFCVISVDLPRSSGAEIRQGQMSDPELKKILNALEKPVRDEDAVYWSNKGYFISSGMLYRYIQDGDSETGQLVIPQAERLTVLQQYHDEPSAGHYGVDKTFERISKRYYWKGMRKDIEKHIKTCIKCQRYKPSNLKPAGLLQTSVMNQRFETLSFDLFGPLPPTLKNQTWIFIVEDIATRWVELFPLEHATAEACADVLLNEVFLRYGMPRRIISDNGTQFVSAVMQKLTFCLDIHHAFTPVYHPETNPVERKNRDLKTQLAILVGDDHRSWVDRLPSIRYAMNTSKCASTNYTPAYLTFGRELRSYDDVKHDLRQIALSENFIPEITPKLILLSEVVKKAQEVQEGQEEIRKKKTDEHRRPSPDYQPGDLVLVATNVLSSSARYQTAKLHPRRDGPYVILRKHGPCSYEISNPSDPNTPLSIYHTSALTPYQGPDLPLPNPERPLRRRGRPKKKTTTSTGLLAEASSSPEGEPVTRRRAVRARQTDVSSRSASPPRLRRLRKPR